MSTILEERRSLEDGLYYVAREIHALTEQRKVEFEWHKTFADHVTKQDLAAMEARILAALQGARDDDLKQLMARLKATSDPLAEAVKANQ